VTHVPGQASALLNTVLRAGEHGSTPSCSTRLCSETRRRCRRSTANLLLSDAFLAYADALARGVLPVEVRMEERI